MKKCTKCNTVMEKEDGVYFCTNCVAEIVRIKRKKWDMESENNEFFAETEGVGRDEVGGIISDKA